MSGRRSTTDEVFVTLRSRILGGGLAPASRHSIYRLAEELDVSRTPVREAVLRLADLGLVSIERNRGITVRGVQADDVREVFELRVMLEVPAAARAAEVFDGERAARLGTLLDQMRAAAAAGDEVTFMRHDRELHAAINESLGNRRLSREVDRLRDSIQVRGVSTVGGARSLAEIAEEHTPIVDAVAVGDPDAAAAAMRAHLEHTAALIMADLAG